MQAFPRLFGVKTAGSDASLAPPPRYSRVPAKIDFPTVDDPPETFVPYFQNQIVHFYRRAYGCLPGEYRPGMFRWHGGRRAGALFAFPDVLQQDPTLAIRGLAQLTRPPLSRLRENVESIQHHMLFDVYSSLVRFLSESDLSPSMAADFALVLDSIEGMQKPVPNYVKGLRAAFNRALETANMRYDQSTDGWASPRVFESAIRRRDGHRIRKEGPTR